MSEIRNTLPSLLDELRQVLEQERQALVTGSLDRINAITQRKLALAEELDTGWASVPALSSSHEILEWLARLNAENAVICSAMVRHLTAALDKLRSNAPHRSYGPDGNEHNGTAPQVLGAA